MTTLDVGHTRVVQIQVTSADRSRVQLGRRSAVGGRWLSV